VEREYKIILLLPVPRQAEETMTTTTMTMEIMMLSGVRSRRTFDWMMGPPTQSCSCIDNCGNTSLWLWMACSLVPASDVMHCAGHPLTGGREGNHDAHDGTGASCGGGVV
jgi:hypothetical protein